MLQDKEPEKSERVMKAILKMEKIDIESLKQAYGQIRPRKRAISIKIRLNWEGSYSGLPLSLCTGIAGQLSTKF
jgi:hypothetical protein